MRSDLLTETMARITLEGQLQARQWANQGLAAKLDPIYERMITGTATPDDAQTLKAVINKLRHGKAK